MSTVNYNELVIPCDENMGETSENSNDQDNKDDKGKDKGKGKGKGDDKGHDKGKGKGKGDGDGDGTGDDDKGKGGDTTGGNGDDNDEPVVVEGTSFKERVEFIATKLHEINNELAEIEMQKEAFKGQTSETAVQQLELLETSRKKLELMKSKYQIELMKQQKLYHMSHLIMHRIHNRP